MYSVVDAIFFVGYTQIHTVSLITTVTWLAFETLLTADTLSRASLRGRNWGPLDGSCCICKVRDTFRDDPKDAVCNRRVRERDACPHLDYDRIYPFAWKLRALASQVA